MNEARSVWTLDEEKQLAELEARKKRIYEQHDAALDNALYVILDNRVVGDSRQAIIDDFKTYAKTLREALKPYDL